MPWYERFSYESNPFELDPFKSDFTLINHIKLMDDLLYLVASGNILVLEGDDGSGKTMFLKQIIERLGGKKKICYVDGRRVKKELDIEQLLNNAQKSLLNSVINKKPKELILLLDNVDTLSARNCEKIKYYFDQNYIKSVVFTSTNYSALDISDSLRNRILNNVIVMPPMNSFEALRIVRERFSDHFFLSDEVILRLFKLSKENIKLTLQNCDAICQFVVKEGRGEVLPKYLPLIVKKKLLKQNKFQRISPQVRV